MKLVIAEKPQLGLIIANAIGIIERQDGYIKCKDDHIVTWAIGHILEIKKVEEMNPNYTLWRKQDLPLNIRPLELKPKVGTIKQFKVIESLLKRATTVINAGDPDDEGQLLIREILEYTQYKGEVLRLLLNDLNIDSARKALTKLRPDSEFNGMYYKALARSQADFIFGINMTRMYTILAREKGFQDMYSIGRVQTPTLGLIVKRYLDNKNHKESFYYLVSGNFDFNNQSLEGKLVLTENIPVNDSEDKNKKIIDENVANKIKNTCEKKMANITQCNVEQKTTACPLPFSLLDLQAKMNEKYGYSSDETLRITQALREKHRAITYNRSDCRYLTSEQFSEAPKTLGFLSSIFPNLPFSEVIQDKKSRAFNDKKVTSHTAIIPVPANFNIENFSEKERNVYQAIAEQYLIQFLPDKVYDQAVAIFKCSEYEFKAIGNKIIDFGWSKLIKDLDDQENNKTFDLISSLQNEQSILCSDINIKKEKTKPLPIYTEATLLKDLQRVARYIEDPNIRNLLIEKDSDKEGENGGIGTPATRSAIIANLNKRGYFGYSGKKLIPTQKGIDFIQSLPKILTVPDMTALWFEQQKEIEKGSLDVDTFLNYIDDFVKEQIELAKNITLNLKGVKCPKCQNGMLMNGSSEKTNSTFVYCSNKECNYIKSTLNGVIVPNCPCCKSEMFVNSKAVSCRNEACNLVIWRTISGKTLSEKQIVDLLKIGKTNKLKGFKSIKSGKEFEAVLILNKNEKKINFSFPNKR